MAEINCSKCGGERRRIQRKSKPTKNGDFVTELICPTCLKLRSKTYKRLNREKYLEGKKRYYQNHKKEHKEYAQKYYKDNEELIRSRAKKYLAENEEKIKIKRKIFRETRRHPDYGVWSHIVQRTTNPNYKRYSSYGQRGIKLYEHWKGKGGFNNFIKYLGPRPEPKHLYSIDRYPNRNGNYEPGNVRWATIHEQQNNTRSNINYKSSIPDDSSIWYNNQWMNLVEFSEITGLYLIAIKYRYAIFPDADYILKWEPDNRLYFYQGHLYNMTELSLISKIRYSVMHGRIFNRKWDVTRAMETPSTAEV